MGVNWGWWKKDRNVWIHYYNWIPWSFEQWLRIEGWRAELTENCRISETFRRIKRQQRIAELARYRSTMDSLESAPSTELQNWRSACRIEEYRASTELQNWRSTLQDRGVPSQHRIVELAKHIKRFVQGAKVSEIHEWDPFDESVRKAHAGSEHGTSTESQNWRSAMQG